MTRTIRDATAGDAHAIATIYVDASLAALGSVADRAAIEAAAAGDHALWRPLLRPAPGQCALVHDEGEAVAGFASFGAAGASAAHLYALYVAPRSWGTGIGSGLLAAALDRLRDLSVARCELWVQQENVRAQRFYRGRGWRATGERRANARGEFLLLATELAGPR